MEQCAIYTFLPVGPTWDGPLGPIFPFWLFLDPVLRGEITKRFFRVGGIRYSVMRVSMGGCSHLVGRNGYAMDLDCFGEGYLSAG